MISAKQCRENNQKYLDGRKEEFEENKNIILEKIYSDLKWTSEDSSENSYTIEFIIEGSVYSYRKYKGLTFNPAEVVYEYFDIDAKNLDDILGMLFDLGFVITKNFREDEEDRTKYLELTIKW